jgi:molybdopterin biosynthesis enzyme
MGKDVTKKVKLENAAGLCLAEDIKSDLKYAARLTGLQWMV